MYTAAIRVTKCTTPAQLRGATLYAQRQGATHKARVREGVRPGFGFAWSKAERARDYLAAFRAHKAEMGAAERKNAPLALHLICLVSQAWVEQAGDLHAPDNPHNRRLFIQAKAWAESWGGKGSVIAMRLDLDLTGGGAVDVLISPVRGSRGKPVISTNKALRELKEAMGERNDYAALQSSWAEWCGAHLDAAIQRGLRKEIAEWQTLSPGPSAGDLDGADGARESVRAPFEHLREALRDTDLSAPQVETLSAFLTIKREIIRHKAQGRAYKPPMGAMSPEGLLH